MTRALPAVALAGALAALLPSPAAAFCGFYVSGGEAELFADATMVVMMRDGTNTVLSMRNDYRGPPADFAMVVPVPEVLDESHVFTLPPEVFDRVDRLAAPRLVEYWEVDPCYVEPPEEELWDEEATEGGAMPEPTTAAARGVTVEAEFAVGEYEIVILSAEDSSGLDTWLREQGYNIPAGAEPRLRPYVEAGSKFFVARVDVSKVTFGDEGVAQLSPLRVHYSSETFALPIRLGLVNASDRPQDLIVHVLARDQRYEVANRPNVTIPTNIDVAEAMRERFGPFYVALFDATVERNPGAVVTEYAWQATNCDPCPGPVLSVADLTLLGGDVVDPVPPGSAAADVGLAGELLRDARIAPHDPRTPPVVPRPPTVERPFGWGNDFVLTRLHARYRASEVEDDLVFRAARPIVGGREFHTGPQGTLEHGASESHVNNFQGRYAIRHPWRGPIECDEPVRGRWGGPWEGETASEPAAAQELAYAPRGAVQLEEAVRSRVPELDLARTAALAGAAPTPVPTTNSGSSARSEDGGGCGCRTGGAPDLAWLGALAFVLFRLRRRAA